MPVRQSEEDEKRGAGTHVELPREAREARLTVNGGKDVQGQLLRTLDDDVLASVVPANHVVILWPLEEAGTRQWGTRRTAAAGTHA